MLERLNCTDTIIMYVLTLLCLVIDESNEKRRVVPDRATCQYAR
jgi:hypothetical protein